MGTVRKPLAVKMWEGVRVAVDPTIAAASIGVIVMAVRHRHLDGRFQACTPPRTASCYGHLIVNPRRRQ